MASSCMVWVRRHHQPQPHMGQWSLKLAVVQAVENLICSQPVRLIRWSCCTLLRRSFDHSSQCPHTWSDNLRQQLPVAQYCGNVCNYSTVILHLAGVWWQCACHQVLRDSGWSSIYSRSLLLSLSNRIQSVGPENKITHYMLPGTDVVIPVTWSQIISHCPREYSWYWSHQVYLKNTLPEINPLFLFFTPILPQIPPNHIISFF